MARKPDIEKMGIRYCVAMTFFFTSVIYEADVVRKGAIIWSYLTVLIWRVDSRSFWGSFFMDDVEFPMLCG